MKPAVVLILIQRKLCIVDTILKSALIGEIGRWFESPFSFYAKIEEFSIRKKYLYYTVEDIVQHFKRIWMNLSYMY